MFVGYNAFDFRTEARRILPRGLFEFVDRGTEDEVALANNRRQLEQIKLVSRVLRDVSGRSTATTLFGKSLSMPLAIAPTGAAGLLWRDGELELAKAAAKADVPFTLATGSLTSMERIAAEAGGRLWFQLYVWPDRAMSNALLRRVQAAGFEALVVTVDNPVPPNREYNQRSGFTIPFRVTRRNLVDVLMHPRWLATVLLRYALTTGLPRYENYPTEMKQRFTGLPMGQSMPRTDSLSWQDFAAIRSEWPRTLIIKGIMHPDDARLAIEHGADAIIVSNHGARVLDPSLAPITALPGIVAAVEGKVPVLVDGGIMRGSDVVKAVALGASAVLVGRATLYGVAVGGQAGADRVLSLLQQEIARILALTGNRSIADLTRVCIASPTAVS